MTKLTLNLNPSISIDGNIGSGKTTILTQLHTEKNLPVFYEKVHEWKFLEDFYKDPANYSLLFQLEVLFSFREAHNCHSPHLLERNSCTGYYVFAKLLKEQGKMTNFEFQTFEKAWVKYKKYPTLIIYLDVSPEICLERIKKRGRGGEEEISLDYLKNLEELYTQYLEKMSQYSDITRISSHHPYEEVRFSVESHIDALK